MNKGRIAQTPLDQLVCSEDSQMLKAAIPYFPPEAQRMLAVLMKYQELRNTISVFSPEKASLSICSAPTTNDPLEMLQDIQNFCYGEKKQKIDQILNLFATVEMIRTFSEISDLKGET